MTTSWLKIDFNYHYRYHCRYNADVNSLATEIAFAEQENYRASSPLCQAARNGYTEASLYSDHISHY